MELEEGRSYFTGWAEKPTREGETYQSQLVWELLTWKDKGKGHLWNPMIPEVLGENSLQLWPKFFIPPCICLSLWFFSASHERGEVHLFTLCIRAGQREEAAIEVPVLIRGLKTPLRFPFALLHPCHNNENMPVLTCWRSDACSTAEATPDQEAANFQTRKPSQDLQNQWANLS